MVYCKIIIVSNASSTFLANMPLFLYDQFSDKSPFSTGIEYVGLIIFFLSIESNSSKRVFTVGICFAFSFARMRLPTTIKIAITVKIMKACIIDKTPAMDFSLLTIVALIPKEMPTQ